MNELEKPPASTPSVVLRGQLVSIDSDVGQMFIVDLCRGEEGILSAEDIKLKWELSDEQAAGVAGNELIVKAVRAESERRMFSGTAPQEAAAFHFAKTPHRLGHMLNDKLEASRVKIDAAKELRAIAGKEGDRSATPGERYTITINLGTKEIPRHPSWWKCRRNRLRRGSKANGNKVLHRNKSRIVLCEQEELEKEMAQGVVRP